MAELALGCTGSGHGVARSAGGSRGRLKRKGPVILGRRAQCGDQGMISACGESGSCNHLARSRARAAELLEGGGARETDQ
jgi:hypothetical protein